MRPVSLALLTHVTEPPWHSHAKTLITKTLHSAQMNCRRIQNRNVQCQVQNFWALRVSESAIAQQRRQML